MAMMKSPSKDVMASLVKSINDLKNEKNPKNHLTIYETLTQLVVKSHLKLEAYDNSLYSVALPIALQDISSGNESLVLVALSFLGGLLQVVKLSQENQDSVIDVLTSKLSNVSEKSQSRRLMWSLANIQLDSQLQESVLEKVLQAALKFLDDKPPVLSLSTVCESLNTLKNLGTRRSEFIEKKLFKVLVAVLPWLFNEADRIRELSLDCLEPFTNSIAEQKLFDVSFQKLLRGKLYGILSQLVAAESADSLKLWSFLIQAFGTQLHDSVTLLNELLKIEESALKCKNPVFRQRALEHWKYIIESFALNPKVLNNSKRVKLILVPLKSTDTRTVDFSKTKIELWWHLLYKLGPDAVVRFQEVTLPLLTFCFGDQDDERQKKGMALVFSNILPLATSVLAGVMSLETRFETSPMEGVLLMRSHPFLSSEDFSSTVDNFSQLALLTLNLKNGTDPAESYGIIIESFIKRCCSANLIEPLKTFFRSLLASVTAKPGLMEVVFDVLAKSFQFDLVTELLASNIDGLLLWFIENEPLPAHPLVRFLTKIFEAGATWNVELFSANVTQTLVALSEKHEQNDASSVAELWSKFATALITKSPSIHVPSAHRQSLLLPLTWSWIESDESIFLPWSTLLSTWTRADPTILAVVLNPREQEEVEVEERIIRAVLSALRSELSSYSTEMSSWINRWITSWMKLANIAENRSKCTDILANFLCAVIDELKVEGNADDLLGTIKTLLQGFTLSKEVSEILQGVFGPVSSAFKTTGVQKLRQHPNICKLFSPLLPRNTPSRNKQKPKFFDDFVIVPPVEKKRVLTEHQKEVMRSKRRASCVPAMYNDLSNSSQQSLSMDTQSRDTSVPVITSCFSLKDDDAFLEPPISLQQPEVLNELPMDNENQTEEFVKTDQKLRSKVSVQMSQLPIRRRSTRRSSPLIDSSPISSADSASPSSIQDNVVFQRPCPASKKTGFALKKQTSKKIRATDQNKSVEQEVVIVPEQGHANENHDKENGLSDSQPTQTSNTFISPRRVPLDPVDQQEGPSTTSVSVPSQTEVIPETQENQVEEIENSAPQVVDISDEEPVLLNESSSLNQVHAKDLGKDSDKLPVDTDQTENEKQITFEVSMSSVEESASNILTEKIVEQPSNQDSTEKLEPEITEPSPSVVVQSSEVVDIKEACSSTTDQQKIPDETPTVEVENSETCSEHVQSETLQQKTPAIIPSKSYIKSFCLRSKRGGTPKTIGPSPTTGKRGAQILELSRKIQSEPPNKKSKIRESSQNEIADPTSVGERVVTPEGSPARTSAWLPRTYSPYASPSTSILKKRSLVEESEETVETSYSPVSSASKSRRVSFADPEVSHSVKISPIKKRLTRTRTRRSLITTYGDSSFTEEPIVKEDKSTILDSNENNLQLSEKSLNDQTESSELSEDASARIDATIESVVEDGSASSKPADQQDSILSVVEEPSQVLKSDEAHIDPQEQSTDTSKGEHMSIYPAAIDCNDSLALIVDRVTSATSRGPIMAVLEKLGVRSIGDFCALSEADIQGLDFHLPQHETIKQFLERHFAKKLAEKSIPRVNESQGLSDTDLPITKEDASNLPASSSDEIRTDELVQSSDDMTKESSKSPDSIPNGQIITDSPETLFSHLSDDKSSPPLDNPDIENYSNGSEDVAMKSESEEVPQNDGNAVDGMLLNLSADEIVNMIERHPQKDNILSIVMRKYVSLCFTVNGKVFPLPN